MKLSYQGIQDVAAWEQAGVALPKFDWKAMRAETEQNPIWVHFGAGNIFRGFIARLQHRLLDQGLVKSGIIAADTFDYDIIDKIYTPFDNMALMVSLLPDGSLKKDVVASIAQGLRAGNAFPEDMEKLKAVFRSPSLQMASYTITEKGYALKNIQGEFFPFVQADFDNGPAPAGEGRGVYDRPGYGEQHREDEGDHLPQSAAHRSGGLRLPAGLRLHCRRDEGPPAQGSGGEDRLWGGHPRGGGPKDSKPHGFYPRGHRQAPAQPLHARHPPAHRHRHQPEGGHPFRRDRQELYRP